MDDAQVEQDLVISRALVEIYSNPDLKDRFAFRGGTALYKLHLPAARYSEDIDLVQTSAETAGEAMSAIRDTLNPWLGEPRYKQTEGRITFRYRFNAEGEPPVPLNLKVEINTREHFSVEGFATLPFEVSSRWYSGACEITTYTLNELVGTKLRALYQRRKGRDLFDLALALEHPDIDPSKVLEIFKAYMGHGGHTVSRAQFEENLRDKLEDSTFMSDLTPLLAEGDEPDMRAMSELVTDKLLGGL
ncbi:MAG: nucleotidyl transferase AbiEii/AbiGii toxin family protein [Gammaproteobacteria bacterium]|nr:nucleotidyl transferase AbiEii/AbiGii toxin family protein [Gammaproteobacteria bacterium]